MFAFLRLGFRDEACSYLTWLHERGNVRRDGAPLQVMYGVDGRSELTEEELPHLSGYRGSGPVRIGNGASTQLQLDVYGEVVDAVYLAERGGHAASPTTLWVKLRTILDWLADNWDQPDEGIWEVRGGRRDFTYSRIMTWVAFDRAIRIQAKRGLPADTHKWRSARDAAYEWVMTHGWSEARQSFNQYADSDVLDAQRADPPARADDRAHRPAHALHARRDPRRARERQLRVPLRHRGRPPTTGCRDARGRSRSAASGTSSA